MYSLSRKLMSSSSSQSSASSKSKENGSKNDSSNVTGRANSTQVKPSTNRDSNNGKNNVNVNNSSVVNESGTAYGTNLSKQIMKLCFLSNLCWTDSSSRRKRRIVFFGEKYDDFYKRLDDKCLDQRHKFHCEFRVELYCEKSPPFLASQREKTKRLYYNEIVSLLRLHLNFPTLAPLSKEKHEYAAIVVMSDDEIINFLESVKEWMVNNDSGGGGGGAGGGGSGGNNGDTKPRIIGETLKAKRGF